MERLTGAQAEARVVPWAANRVADENPLGERAVVVRARRTDSVKGVTAPREQHSVLTYVARDHLAVGKRVDG